MRFYIKNISLYLFSNMFIILKIHFLMSVKHVFDFGKYKRQIEILGLCLPDIKERDIITIYELCELFEVSIATIERDLNDLRERGIPIHSQAKDGIALNGIPGQELLKNEMLRYLSICYADNFDELLDFSYGTDKKKKWDVLTIFVKLQKCIDDLKYADVITIGGGYFYSCIPRKIVRKNKQWFLIADFESYFEVIPVSEISDVFISDNPNVKRYLYGIDEFIEMHFKSVPENKHELKLAFASKINGAFPSQISRVEILSVDSKGNKTVSAVCNDLDDIVPWLISNAGNIIVLEPPELKEKLINIAKAILWEYDPNPKVLFSREYIEVPPFIKNEHGVLKYYQSRSNYFFISITI
jgi:hypothetical protein